MNKKIICRDINKIETEVEIDKLIYRPSIYGILIEDNKILLSKQWDGYDMPGGGANIDETLEEALKREFIEETGIIVEVGAPVHVETSFFHPSHSIKRKDEYWNCPLMYFLVRKIGGSINKDNFDEDEKNYADLAEWIDLSEIENIKFMNSVDSAAIIKRAIKINN